MTIKNDEEADARRNAMQALAASIGETRNIHISGVTVEDDRAGFNVTFRLAVERDVWDMIESMARNEERPVPSFLRRHFQSQMRMELRLRQLRIEEAKARQASEASSDVAEDAPPIPPIQQPLSLFGQLIAELR